LDVVRVSPVGRSGAQRDGPHYAIASLDEADAYLRHPILGPRLIDCSELVNRVEGRSVNEIFGSPDDLKFHSCMTLFSLVQDTAPVFKVALAKYFGGALDQLTTEQLATKGAHP
jgi:uncharacterized protein (DUF1810 family)